MDNSPLDLIILAAVIVTAVVIIVALDRRTKKKGSILGDSVTPGDWLSVSTVPAPPPPLPTPSAIETLEMAEEKTFFKTRAGKFFKTFGLLLILALLVAVAAFWAAAHPESKLTDTLIWIIVIGIVVVPILSRILHFVAFIRKK